MRWLFDELFMLLLTICLVNIHKLVNKALFLIGFSLSRAVLIIKVLDWALEFGVAIRLLSQVCLAPALRYHIALLELWDASLSVFLKSCCQENLILSLRLLLLRKVRAWDLELLSVVYDVDILHFLITMSLLATCSVVVSCHRLHVWVRIYAFVDNHLPGVLNHLIFTFWGLHTLFTDRTIMSNMSIIDYKLFRWFLQFMITGCQMIQIRLIQQILIQVYLWISVNLIRISILLLSHPPILKTIGFSQLHFCLRSNMFLIELFNIHALYILLSALRVRLYVSSLGGAWPLRRVTEIVVELSVWLQDRLRAAVRLFHILVFTRLFRRFGASGLGIELLKIRIIANFYASVILGQVMGVDPEMGTCFDGVGLD